MKRIQDIEKLTAEDLARIGADESIPVSEDLAVKLPGRDRRPAALWSAAASIAVVAGLGLGALLRTPEPKDTFTDPYMAYAAVEEALNRMGGTIQESASLLAQTEKDYNKINYWK